MALQGGSAMCCCPCTALGAVGSPQCGMGQAVGHNGAQWAPSQPHPRAVPTAFCPPKAEPSVAWRLAVTFSITHTWPFVGCQPYRPTRSRGATCGAAAPTGASRQRTAAPSIAFSAQGCSDMQRAALCPRMPLGAGGGLRPGCTPFFPQIPSKPGVRPAAPISPPMYLACSQGQHCSRSDNRDTEGGKGSRRRSPLSRGFT